MNKLPVPSSVEIRECSLGIKSAGLEIGILDQIISFDIWEDVSKPTIYAELHIQDYVDLLNKAPIIGEEEIKITFNTPSAPAITYVFKVFEICNIKKTNNARGMNYTIRCVSREHFTNSMRFITQSYEGVISDIVPQVLSQFLGSNKPIVIDPTKGLQTLVVPRLNPLSFIDMCRQRAVSKQYSSSSYVFFENQDGFHFKTIEGLITDNLPLIGSKEFTFKLNNTLPDISKNRDLYSIQYRTLQSFEIVQDTDSIERMSLGTFKAVTKTFDIATKKFNSIVFDLRSELDKYKFPNTNEKISNTPEFIQEYESDTPQQFFRFTNSLAPENYIDTAMALRNSYKNLLNTSYIRIKVHGDSTLKAGSIINVNIPVGSGFDEVNKRDASSGNFLILRLRHLISGGVTPTHEVVMDCTKVL